MGTLLSDMAFDLHQSIKTLYTPQWIEALAARSGEDAAAIQKAIEIANAVAAYQVFFRIRQPQKRLGIHRMAKVAAGSSVSKELTHLFDGKAHLQGILNMTRILLGDEYRAVEKLISEHTHLREATIRALLQVCIPAMLSICGSKIASRKLNPEGFAFFMEGLKPELELLIPAGIQLPVLQWENATVNAIAGYSKKPAKKKPAAAALLGRIKWSLFALAGLAMVWYLLLK